MLFFLFFSSSTFYPNFFTCYLITYCLSLCHWFFLDSYLLLYIWLLVTCTCSCFNRTLISCSDSTGLSVADYCRCTCSAIFAITLILIIVVLSSVVFPITNFAYALSKKHFLYSSSALPLQSSNEFLIKWFMNRVINVTMIIS